MNDMHQCQLATSYSPALRQNRPGNNSPVSESSPHSVDLNCLFSTQRSLDLKSDSCSTEIDEREGWSAEDMVHY